MEGSIESSDRLPPKENPDAGRVDKASKQPEQKEQNVDLVNQLGKLVKDDKGLQAYLKGEIQVATQMDNAGNMKRSLHNGGETTGAIISSGSVERGSEAIWTKIENALKNILESGALRSSETLFKITNIRSMRSQLDVDSNKTASLKSVTLNIDLIDVRGNKIQSVLVVSKNGETAFGSVGNNNSIEPMNLTPASKEEFEKAKQDLRSANEAAERVAAERAAATVEAAEKAPQLAAAEKALDDYEPTPLVDPDAELIRAAERMHQIGYGFKG